jgi:hypothetical protein
MARIEALVPGLLEARAKEQENRALAFAGITHRVCGREIRPLTPRARLELQLVRNAFFLRDGKPDVADVFQFLWTLDPGRLPLQGLARPLSEIRQWRLRQYVRKLDLGKAFREIRAYLVEQLQDEPADYVDDGTRADVGAWIHWIASDAGFFLSIHGGFTLEAYMETPYLVLQQLIRVWQANNPRLSRNTAGEIVAEDPAFINSSDRLISRWHLQHRDRVAEIHRAPRNRLP